MLCGWVSPNPWELPPEIDTITSTSVWLKAFIPRREIQATAMSSSPPHVYPRPFSPAPYYHTQRANWREQRRFFVMVLSTRILSYKVETGYICSLMLRLRKQT